MRKIHNILHWPTSYPDPSKNKNYSAIFVQEHILSTKYLVKNRVLFISPDGTKKKNKWHEQITTVENGIPVTRFYFNRSLNLTFLNLYIRLILLMYFLELILIERFYPSIIHIHFHQSFFWAKLYSKLFKIPIVITEHWSAFLGWPNIGLKRYKKAAQAFNYSKRILSVSLKIQKGITTYTGEIIDYKSIVIPNAVNTEVFKYEHTQSNNQDFKFLIFVGRNAVEKDIPTLLQGVALIKKKGIKCKLHLVGDGDYYNIKELIDENLLQNEVVLHGQQDKLAINKLLNKSDLLLLTSTIENSPCVLGEAQCCGVPVVATNVGGVKELIIEGAVVPPKSPELLAEKILQQLIKKVDREKLAIEAQKRFSYESIGKQIFDVYKKVCAE